MTYRTGGHWGRTIIRVGKGLPDANGRRPDDELIGLMDDAKMAKTVCELLNAHERSVAGIVVTTR